MMGFINDVYDLALSIADDRKQKNLELKAKIEALETEAWQLKTSEKEALALLEKEQSKVNKDRKSTRLNSSHVD